MVVYVDEARCVGCGVCIETCPLGAIALVDNVATIDQGRCTGCQACVQACPDGAILVVTEPVEEKAMLPRVQPRSRVAPRKAVSPTIPLGRQLVPLVGSALVFLGREVAPRLATYLVDTLDRRLGQRSAGLPVEKPLASAAKSQPRGGPRFRQRRRGR